MELENSYLQAIRNLVLYIFNEIISIAKRAPALQVTVFTSYLLSGPIIRADNVCLESQPNTE